MFYFLDDWFFIILLLGVWLVAIPVYLLAKTSRLSRELERLTSLVEGVRVPGSAPSVAEVRAQFHDVAVTPLPIPIPTEGVTSQMYADKTDFSASRSEETESALITWLKEDLLVKIGAFLLLLALAWFVSYAFANNWIGPVGRIILGLMLGVAVLVFGAVRIQLYKSQGEVFSVLGSTIVILTVSAAQYIYEMFTPTAALGMMFLMVLFVAFLSLKHHRVSLAYSSLCTALVAPFLINASTADPVLLMFYLLVVVIGTLGVVWFLAAPTITLVALFGVLYYTGLAYDLDQMVALLFGFIFTGIFFITNVVSLMRGYAARVLPVQITTALITGIYLISVILTSAAEEWITVYLLTWSVILAYGSFLVFMHTKNKLPFYIYAAVSMILLGSATALELEGSWLTITLTAEILASIMLMARVAKHRTALNLTTALLVIPGLLTLEHIGASSWNFGVLHGDFAALLVFTGGLVAAWYIRATAGLREENDGTDDSAKVSTLFIIASLYGLVLIWLVLHSLFIGFMGTLLSLVVYSLLGLYLFITGRTEGQSAKRLSGILLLLFVIARLLLVDVWELDTAGRIITFLVIGLLFISTAFLPKPKTNPNE